MESCHPVFLFAGNVAHPESRKERKLRRTNDVFSKRTVNRKGLRCFSFLALGKISSLVGGQTRGKSYSELQSVLRPLPPDRLLDYSAVRCTVCAVDTLDYGTEVLVG